MTTAKVTTKGQITIPKEVRDALGLSTGDEVEFVPLDHGFRVEKKLNESPFAHFRGISRKRFEKMGFKSTDEFMAAIRGR